MVLEFICVFLSVVFFWSTVIVMIGLLRRDKRHPRAEKTLKFAVFICARNEERVIRFPIESVLASEYPAAGREVFVLADNCTDGTAAVARAAGATVWEKTTPSSGKGDVLSWGLRRLAEERPEFEAVAVFDADNQVCAGWFHAMNNALNDGEDFVTGRRYASNAEMNVITGWYAIYWDLMNELSNRVRTNLGLSAKLTGTGFAFRREALGPDGWNTHTLVEDVEFTIQTNLAGRRIVYEPRAGYSDEQPTTVYSMWRQLRRWTTGGWQVVRSYFLPWFKAMCRQPSFRLFDSYFAMLTGMSVAFVIAADVLALLYKVYLGEATWAAYNFFFCILAFVILIGWFTSVSAVALSRKRRQPKPLAVFLFPLFSLILSAGILYTLVIPSRRWKPIPHGETAPASRKKKEATPS